jgi:hypothetical protein
MNKNVRLEESVPATLRLSTAQIGASLLVLEGALREHRCRILVDSGASREHHIPTVFGEKYRIKLANGYTTTTRQRLRNEVLIVGTMDIRMDAFITELDKFHIILGQPWLQDDKPDIDWSTEMMRDREIGETMVHGDKYTVLMAVHHLEADAMARLLKQQPAYLFVIGLREVHDAVDDIKTNKQT